MNYNNYDIRLKTNATKRQPAPRKAACATARPSKLRRILRAATAAFMLSATAADAQIVLQPNEAASKDAKTYRFLPANNFQSNLGIIGADYTPHEFRSLLQFDLTTVTAPAADVTSATLEVWVSAATPGDGSVTHEISLHEITGTWDETAVTWDTFPAFNPVAVDHQTVTTPGVWVSFDVTSSVLAWLTAPASNNGWALIPGAATNVIILDADGVTGATPDPTKAPRLTIHLSKQILVQTGDTVPGIAGKTFTAFGIPAINENGDVAVLGKFPGGSTILVNGDRVLTAGDPVVALDETPLPGVTVKTLKDPVISPDGLVMFIGKLAGSGITSSSDTAVLAATATSPATGIVVAQEGAPAPGTAPGTTFRSFLSAASPGSAAPVLVLAKLTGGGATSANDDALYACDGSVSSLAPIIREGVTTVGGKTVKKFSVLKVVPGTPGQTHAFNSAAQLVCNVQFDDNTQAAVLFNLPVTPPAPPLGSP